jgi:hypothetical protein
MELHRLLWNFNLFLWCSAVAISGYLLNQI